MSEPRWQQEADYVRDLRADALEAERQARDDEQPDPTYAPHDSTGGEA